MKIKLVRFQDTDNWHWIPSMNRALDLNNNPHDWSEEFDEYEYKVSYIGFYNFNDLLPLGK